MLYLMAAAGSGASATRVDPHSSYRPGFDLRCRRLCQRALMVQRFDEPPFRGRVVRSTEFSYQPDPCGTKMVSAQVKGWTAGGAVDTGCVLPPLSFGYTAAEMGTTVEVATGLDEFQGLDLSLWQFVDLDGEGLSGLLSEQGGALLYKRSEGHGGFARARTLQTRPSMPLGGLRVTDVQGDGKLDLVRIGKPPHGYFARSDDGGFEAFRPFRSVPTDLDLRDPNTRMLDLDGDGLADALITEGDCLRWFPSEGEAGYGKGTYPHPHPPTGR